MGFLCVDCGKVGRDTPISREQAIQTEEKFGRGLCEDCAFITKPKGYFAQAAQQDRLTIACTEEWYDAKGEKHVTQPAEGRT